MKLVKEVIDQLLAKMKDDFFPMTAVEETVPEIMKDDSMETDEDYIGWKAISSDINNNDISNLESELNCTLPESYKEYLKYKYLMELYLFDSAVKLHTILPTTKLDALREMNLNYNDPKEIIKKGYFYFADFHDYGLLTFDTNSINEENEHKIVFMMHDDLQEKYLYANSFSELLNQDSSYSNEFIDRYNKR